MKMESVGHRLPIILLLCCILFLLILTQSIRADGNDEEDHLLQGINSYRQSLKVPALAKHDKANCVADQIADQLEDRKCNSNASPPMQSQLVGNYSNVFRKCDVDINTTRDGMILPVCVANRVATLVLTNYTQSLNSRYVNDSRFTGAGIATEDDWTVVVLTTNTPRGSFASIGHHLVIGSGWYLAPLIMVAVLI